MERVPILPLIKQKTNHTCGAASLLCVLRFYGRRGIKEEILAKELKTDIHRGVASLTLALVAKRHGLKAQKRQGLKMFDISDELKKNHLIIVDFQAWRSHQEQRFPWRKIWVDGHYAVVQAMNRKHVWLMDPWLGKIIRLTHKRFLTRWHTAESKSSDNVGPRYKFVHSAVIINGQADKL